MEDHQSTEKCNNCLCQLPICQAECCKEYSINIDPHKVYKKGQVLTFKVEGDKRFYMLLHGAVSIDDKHVAIMLENFKKQGKKMIIFSKCRLLTEGNMCSEHFTKNRPKMCEYPNKDGIRTDMYYTKNCIFRR